MALLTNGLCVCVCGERVLKESVKLINTDRQLAERKYRSLKERGKQRLTLTK